MNSSCPHHNEMNTLEQGENTGAQMLDTPSAETMSEPRLAKRIGRRLRDFRKARGLTLLQIAQMVDTTPQTIQRLEMANITISIEWIEKLCSALQIDPFELFTVSGQLALVSAKCAKAERDLLTLKTAFTTFSAIVQGACHEQLN